MKKIKIEGINFFSKRNKDLYGKIYYNILAACAAMLDRKKIIFWYKSEEIKCIIIEEAIKNSGIDIEKISIKEIPIEILS